MENTLNSNRKMESSMTLIKSTHIDIEKDSANETYLEGYLQDTSRDNDITKSRRFT